MPPPESPDPTHVFATLDAELPLALLPVRVETRWRLEHHPPELHVRIFPDVVHADGHTESLSASEQELGRAFWRRSLAAGRDVAAKDAAFAWLAGQLGPWRAAWVARTLAPAEGDPLRFPHVETTTAGAPTWARLLPERFSATLLGPVLSEPGLLGTWWGAPIDGDVAMAPGTVDSGDPADGRDWLAGQGLDWAFDFEAAEEAGLGIRIDLSGFSERQRTDGFAYLVVCGVRGGDVSGGLEALLTAHRYTHGLDFIPQGTPTNTTETSAPGLSLEAPDLAALRAAELAPPRPRPGAAALAPPPAHEGDLYRNTAAGAAPPRPPAGPPRPPPAREGDLYRGTAARVASDALGMGPENPLHRCAHAALAELRWAEAMNRALWPGLAGHYLAHVLDGVVSDAGRAWLRNWAVTFARGGATLPTLLVGSQPYGLLPVSLVTAPGRGSRTEIETVEDVLTQLRIPWVADAQLVPRLDPDAPDVAEDGTESEGQLAARVSKVLGAVPHPTGFRVQRAEPMRSSYFYEWQGRLINVGLACGSPPPGQPPYEEYTDGPHWPDYARMQDALAAAQSPLGQKVALDELARALDTHIGAPSQAQIDYDETWAAYTRESLVDFVEAHMARTAPLLSLVALGGLTGKMGELAEPNAFYNLHPGDGAATWELPLVAPDRSEAALADLRDWLDQLAAGLDDHLGHDHSFTAAHPLLRMLLRWSIQEAGEAGDQAIVRDGLAGDPGLGLVGLPEIARAAADPVGELERLMRETLGVHGHRLDAWYTAVAAWRLDGKRTKRPTGIHAGAYGLLADVKPGPAEDLSQGFVLAPSLTHATTAAVLRSGWAALGESGEGAGLAVDLSSDRVRRARWIVDGVRQGQDLARLLGARVERGLHDAELDTWVTDFRQLALDARGDPAAPNAIVDGLLLARARLGADDLEEERDAGAALTVLLAGAKDDRDGLEGVLDSLAADLDAVADAAVTQSVFSLVQGNVPEAATALTAAATGEVTFPELRFADTPRPAIAITHRLLALLPAREAEAPPPASGRALASPALDAWLAGLLGPLSAYRFAVRFGDGAVAEATLADVGLSALDVVFLAPAGEDAGLGRLGAVLTAWAQARHPDAVVDTGPGDPSIDELAVACRSLRRLVGEARDLDGRDLGSPGATDVVAGVDVGELEGRATAVRDALQAGRARLAAALGAGGDVGAAMLALAGFELAAGVPAGDDLAAEGAALLTDVDARLDAAAALVDEQDEAWSGLDDLARVAALRDRFRLLVGQALPLAPRFAPGNGAELDTSFARPRLRGRDDATGWLAAAGRVDPGAQRLRVAVDLAEAVRDDVLFGFELGQLPDGDEPWAAVARPGDDERGRTCLLATGSLPRFADGGVAGLVLSTWTEAVPRARQTAGLAVHFDAPAARAPQAILLCSAEPQRGFDFELVRDVVTQTFELARMRMAGPETLTSMGQYLPAAYLDPDTNPGAPA